MARRDELWNSINGTYIQTIAPLGYDILINGSNKYLNFNITSGSSGYGFRDNSGVMEIKWSGEQWATLKSIVVSASAPSTPYTNQLWYDIS